MSYTNLLKIALKAILSNKGRSFLSMLGIIIGVGAVIVMMAIGQGSVRVPTCVAAYASTLQPCRR